jgi:hypothetical protein
MELRVRSNELLSAGGKRSFTINKLFKWIFTTEVAEITEASIEINE